MRAQIAALSVRLRQIGRVGEPEGFDQVTQALA